MHVCAYTHTIVALSLYFVSEMLQQNETHDTFLNIDPTTGEVIQHPSPDQSPDVEQTSLLSDHVTTD